MLVDWNYKSGGDPISELIFVTHKGKGRHYLQRMQSHQAHEVIYLDYGEAVLTLDGDEMLLKPGYCVFVKGGSAHSFRGVAGAPFDYLNICYKGIFPELLDATPQPVRSPALEILEKLKRESLGRQQVYAAELSSALLAEFIYQMARISASEEPEPPQPMNSVKYRSEIVRKAMAVIERDFRKEISFAELASASGVGVSHLRELIVNETGRNFSQHLQAARVEAAKRMLRETSKSIGEVASEVGYSSIPFFFKVFRRFTGMTPKEYAKSLGDPEKFSP